MENTVGAANYRGKAREVLKTVVKNRFFYIIALPAIILTIIFNYVPMYGIVLAFKNYKARLGILGSPWVGFENFETLFAYPEFWTAFKNTVIINLLKFVVGFPSPIMLAVMVNAIRRKLVKSATQTILYLPHFMSWVIVANMVFSLLDTNGPLTVVLNALGGNGNYMADGSVALLIIVLSDLWKEVGWGAIIYLAALSTISPEYYEAAKVDGASTVKQFWAITLPMLMPTISIMLILRAGSLIGGGFDQIYSLFKDNVEVENTTEILDTYIYKFIGKGVQYGVATAVGLFVNISNLFLLVLTNFSVKMMGGELLY